MKKYAVIICVLAVMVLMPITVWAADGGSVDARNYSYSVTPVMEPFNGFFFVKTDNPDPRTFRFEDKSSVYRIRPYILRDVKNDGSQALYADVNYEDENTGRVSGGYIFYGGGTDGGELVLEVCDDPGAYYLSWKETGTKITLPKLKSTRDYLIDTYAKKSSFFDNLDAVQDGLRSISLYSGSFVRGRLNKAYDHWLVSLSPHVDQNFYIFSPYEREDNRTLFSSAVYPYLLDSWGFPGMMESVASALNSSAKIEWSSSSHDQVEITYNGETHVYGGQGGHPGQSIGEDNIKRRFTFGSGSAGITLDSMRSLLIDYTSVQMEDDIPREDALTWKQIFNTVGSGSWARVSPGGKGPSSTAFAYFYQQGDGNTFDTSEKELGTSLYWGGDLAFAEDAWVDGRYVDKWKGFVRGERFEDHPTSSIIVKDVMVPQIPHSYKYEKNAADQWEMVYYVTGDITEKKRTVVYKYQNGEWVAWNLIFDNGCANYEAIRQMADRGVIDSRYLDKVLLTKSEVDALGVDSNTNVNPDKGFVYDGSAKPGTAYDESAGHSWNKGKVEKEPDCDIAGRKVYTCLVCGQTRTETIAATGHKWGKPSYTWEKDYSKVRAARTCQNNSKHVESETMPATENVLKAVSCDDIGIVEYTAAFNNPAFNPVKRRVFVNQLGHSWGKYEVITAPTAENEGTKAATCVRCGTRNTIAIPKVVNDITPTLEVADKAPSDKSIPKISAAKIKTSGSVLKGQLKIQFPVSTAADNYLIQHRVAGTAQPVNGWSNGKGSYTIKGLKKNSLVQFRIIGYAKQYDWSWHCGTWSDVSYRYMRSVKLKKVTPGKKKLTVTWAKDSNSSGYYIQYSTKKSMAKAKTIKISKKSKTKYTIRKLKKGKKYYVKVMPVKVKSGKTYTGILSKAKSAKVK